MRYCIPIALLLLTALGCPDKEAPEKKVTATPDDEAVHAAVFMNLCGGSGPDNPAFLSIDRLGDLSPELMRRVAAKGLTVKPYSESVRDQESGRVRHKSGGSFGSAYRIEKTRWINDTTVEVVCSFYRTGKSAGGYVIRLSRVGSEWKVVEKKGTWES